MKQVFLFWLNIFCTLTMFQAMLVARNPRWIIQSHYTLFRLILLSIQMSYFSRVKQLLKCKTANISHRQSKRMQIASFSKNYYLNSLILFIWNVFFTNNVSKKSFLIWMYYFLLLLDSLYLTFKNLMTNTNIPKEHAF